MKLVPLLLLFCTLCSAKKKIKKIKRLIVAIGSIASLARGGGGGIAKSLQLLTQRGASSGQQYANNYVTQPLVLSTITSTNPVVVNSLQPQLLSTTAVVNQHTVLHRKIAVPVPAPYAVPVPKDVFVAVDNPVAVPINKLYPVPVPIASPISIDQPIPVTTNLDQTPFFHQAGVGLGVAQSFDLVGPLVQSGWAG